MQSKQRLDVELVQRGLVQSRSQAENYVKLGVVYVNKKVIQKAGTPVAKTDEIDVQTAGQYVSRAGLKLASVAEKNCMLIFRTRRYSTLVLARAGLRTTHCSMVRKRCLRWMWVQTSCIQAFEAISESSFMKKRIFETSFLLIR